MDEGTDSSNTVDLTVSRSTTSGDVSVDVQTTDDTAVVGSDYVDPSQTINFSDGGGKTKTVTLETMPDDVRELDKDFSIDLANPSEGKVSSTNGSVDMTIVDDDPNQDPQITAPDSANAFIGTKSDISGISFNDPDDNTGFTATVSAEGTSQLSVSDPGSATLEDANGNGIVKDETNNTIVISGTQTAVNTALSNVQYVSNATTPGVEAMDLQVEDQWKDSGSSSTTITIDVGKRDTFTTATDDDFAGSSGNDIFVADQSSSQVLQSGDQADGLDGQDTLEVTSNTGQDTIDALDNNAISNVQAVEITAEKSNDSDTETIDMADFSQDVNWVQFTTNASDGADEGDTLTADNVDSGTEFEFTNNAGRFTVSSMNNAGSSDTVTVTLTGDVTLPDIEDSNQNIDTLYINSNGNNANKVTDLAENNALADGANVNIKGAADFTIDLGSNDFDTIDGSNAEGALTIDGSSVGANNSPSIAGGTGNDTLTGSTNTGTTLFGNEGDDTLNSAAASNSKADTLDGGAGADVINLDNNSGTAGDTIVLEAGDSGSSAGERDTVNNLLSNVKFDLSSVSDFGLSGDDTLNQVSSNKAADGSLDVYQNTTNQTLVYETADDGSSVTTNEVNIGEFVSATMTYKDAGTPDDTSDDYIELGNAPLSITNDEAGTLTASGSNLTSFAPDSDMGLTLKVNADSTPTKGTDAGNTLGTSVGTNPVNKIDASDVVQNGVVLQGSSQSDTLIGSDLDDLLNGVRGQNEDITGAAGDDDAVMLGNYNDGAYNNTFEGGFDVDAHANGASGSYDFNGTIDLGANNDKLDTYGAIDMSDVELIDIENINAHSNLVLTVDQLNSLDSLTFEGEAVHTLRIEGTGEADFDKITVDDGDLTYEVVEGSKSGSIETKADAEVSSGSVSADKNISLEDGKVLNIATAETDSTIQEAVDAASPDNTLLVGEGDFDATTISTDGLTLEGAYANTVGYSEDRVSENETIINGSGEDNAIEFGSDTSATIKGITAKPAGNFGGIAQTDWDAAATDEGQAAHIINNRILEPADGWSDSYGNSIEVVGSDSTVEGNYVEMTGNNNPTIDAMGIIGWEGDNIEIKDNKVVQDADASEGQNGIGIVSWGFGELNSVIEGAVIDNNTVESEDTGIAVYSVSGENVSVTIENNTINENQGDAVTLAAGSKDSGSDATITINGDVLKTGDTENFATQAQTIHQNFDEGANANTVDDGYTTEYYDDQGVEYKFSGEGNFATITGTADGDTIVGTAGNDDITGKGSGDTITGGGGDDTINLGSDGVTDEVNHAGVSADGSDTISNFTSGTDKLDINADPVGAGADTGTGTNGTDVAFSASTINDLAADTAATDATTGAIWSVQENLASSTDISNAVNNAATALSDTTDFSGNFATNEGGLILMDDTAETFVYEFDASGDSTPSTTSVGDLQLIGIVESISNSDSMVQGDFA